LLEWYSEKVADYIDQYHFYQNALLRDAILNWLRQNLSLKRYRHVLGVEHSAVSLAMRYGADENQASLAALLHDCAKEVDFQTLCDLVKRAGLDDPDFAFAPHLMHARPAVFLRASNLALRMKRFCMQFASIRLDAIKCRCWINSVLADVIERQDVLRAWKSCVKQRFTI
jgi:hypothetical protein